MIVFVNGPLSAGTLTVARALLCRFERAALIDVHSAAAVRPPPDPLYVDAAVLCLVEFHQERGVGDFVLSGVFETAAALARLRGEVSVFDDVTYAYCLDGPPQDGAGGAISPGEQRRAAEVAKQQRAEAQGGDIGFFIAAEGRLSAQVAGAIWDDLHEAVTLVEPDVAWPARFAEERASLAAALGGLAEQIHHIGSTAVAGLPAKAVIDIMVAAPQLDEATIRGCIASLTALGYVFVDYPQNTDRLFFRKGTPRSHHLHIVASDSQSLTDHLAFRDALIERAELRRAYEALKRSLATAHGDDRATYSARKTALIAAALGHAPR